MQDRSLNPRILDTPTSFRKAEQVKEKVIVAEEKKTVKERTNRIETLGDFPGGTVRLRIRLPMQGTQIQSLVQEDPTCRRSTKPVHHNY